MRLLWCHCNYEKNNWSTPWHQICFAAVKEWGSLSLLACLPSLQMLQQQTEKPWNIQAKNQRNATGPCYMQDIRFALPIIGTEEASTLLSQGFPNLRSSGLHHLGFYGFFCGVNHNGFSAADIAEERSQFTETVLCRTHLFHICYN